MKFHHLLWLSLFAASGSVTLDAQRPAGPAGLDGFDSRELNSRATSTAARRHSVLAWSEDEDDDSDRQGRGKRRSVRDRDDDDRDSDRDSDSDDRNRRRRPRWGGVPDRETNRDALLETEVETTVRPSRRTTGTGMGTTGASRLCCFALVLTH